MSSIQVKQRPSNNRAQQGDDILQRILSARGINSAGDTDYALKKLLPPAGLSHIQGAAQLLADAITSNGSVLIIGDFDADGATSCALAIRCLKAFGLQQVDYLVPNRFEFGYGLTPEIVGIAATMEPDLIVTVDNGISSVDGVYVAQQLGMSVLVTDHHLPGDEIPTADVIVNPNLPGDRFASKNLAGVGVIFYVMLALRAHLRRQGWFERAGITEPVMTQFLDLVALGTVADVVPLDYNNRILVQQGLERIRAGKACSGINALMTIAKRSIDRAATADMGFAIGPRINAAGRLEDMSIGIECLLTDNADAAMQMATQLDELNRARRDVEAVMQQEALAIVDKVSVDDGELPSMYVLHDKAWHQGVVGLVASRIKEKTQRPVLAMALAEEGVWKGSCRSVAGVHIRDLLARVDALHPGLIMKYGGHAMAAGLSVSDAKLADFITALEQVADDFTKEHDWQSIVWTDGELNGEDFTIAFADQLRFMPWGQGFPEPVFEGLFTVQDSRAVGEVHAKLKLQPKDHPSVSGGISGGIDAIFFGYLNDHDVLPNGEIHAVYRLDVNEFRERQSLQLILQHVQPLS